MGIVGFRGFGVLRVLGSGFGGLVVLGFQCFGVSAFRPPLHTHLEALCRPWTSKPNSATACTHFPVGPTPAPRAPTRCLPCWPGAHSRRTDASTSEHGLEAVLTGTAHAPLYRAPGTGQVPPEELRRREKVFLAGQWLDLLREAASAAQQQPRTQGRATTTQGDEEEEDLRRRAERAGALAHFGELSDVTAAEPHEEEVSWEELVEVEV